MEPTREEWTDWAAVMAAKEVTPQDLSPYNYLLQVMGMSPDALRQMRIQAYMRDCTCFVCSHNRQSQGGLSGLLGDLGGFGAGVGGYADRS